MDSPQRISISIQQPQSLSPSNSIRSRRTSSASNSLDFEFWMVRNPSFPQPNLLSADQLFAGGVLRPLQHLHLQNPDPDPEPKPVAPGPEISPASITAEISPASITANAESAPALTASKRWKDLFKKGDKKASLTEKQQEENNNNNKLEKERKREKKSQGGASSSAELNINIWPFSRSRSAGNSVTRPKFFPGAPGARKVSSAPCSRSNSAGESKSRKWPSSPGRPGVHLGRSSPVWQVRRGSGSNSISSGSKTNNNHYLEPSSSSSSRSGEKGVSKKEVTETRHCKRISTISSNNINNSGDAASRSARVLNLNVPTCIGYRHHLSCRSDENSAVGIGGGKHGGHGGGTGTTNNSGINVGGVEEIWNKITGAMGVFLGGMPMGTSLHGFV